MAQCPFCEKPIKENVTQCPHCGAPIKPTTFTSPAQTETKSQGICPNCKSPVNKTDIICIYCGTNLLTGTKISAEPPKERKKILPSINKKYLLVGLLIVVVLIAIGIGIVYLTYDPVASAISLSRTNLLGAIDILQKYIAKNPQNHRAHFILGKLYLKNNQYDEALMEFEKVITANDKENDAVWLALLVAVKKGDKNQQLKYLKLLAQRYPERNDIKLLNILAEGNISQIGSIESFMTLAKNFEKNKDNLNSIIALLLLNKNYDEAIQLINDSEISPKTAVLLLSRLDAIKDEQKKQQYISILGQNFQGLSDTEKALVACQILQNGDNALSLQILQTLKSKEKIPSVLNYLYALTLLNAGLTTEAIVELEKIRSSDGDYSIEASLDLASIYFQQDNITKATELIQSVKNKGKQTSRCYLLEGKIALANNDTATAQQCFASAIQKDPQYAPAYLESGLLYIQRGVLSEGLKNLKTYVQIVKNSVPNYSTAEIEVLMEQIEQTLLDNKSDNTKLTSVTNTQRQ